MHVDVNGARLWYDVDGASLLPAGRTMRSRPTVVLVHGGPGGYDHSYFKPSFTRVSDWAQVVYLDLRDHGRSSRHDPARWSLTACADDLRAFCDALGITEPVVLGHSMGGMVAMLYAVRHPRHPGALVLQSTMARFDLARIVEGFRRVAGDEVAELARRDYGGTPVTDREWSIIFAAFGPQIPDPQALARRVHNPELDPFGMDELRRFDIVAELTVIRCPVLVCVGERDPVTPVAAAREIHSALRPGTGRLEVLGGAGHFPWLDIEERYFSVLEDFGSTSPGR